MIYSDFLVIGSGIAGLIYALDVAEHAPVTVLCKGELSEGNTRYAQGGIASVTSPNDRFEDHIQDTLVAGAGICDPEVVNLVIQEAPASIEYLANLGVNFDRETTGDAYHLGREGGHSARRILHAGDSTGLEIQRALVKRAKAHPNIKILEDHIAIDLILDSDVPEHPASHTQPRVIGVYALNKKSGEIITLGARLTMLASGGMGKAYLYTSNPDVATGDGIAMAYRAGAVIENMEFIQFHPTCLYHPKAKSFLITEAMRGEGALLKTIRGQRFMPSYHEMAELAPRDIVARAIDDVMKKTGDDYVLLDISSRESDFILQHFPMIASRTKEFGFDITKEPLPVVPAAHYCCGGVKSDLWARTSLSGLFAAGEVACTGLHGANRLASNSLLEAIVFARRAAKQSLLELPSTPPLPILPEWDPLDTKRSSEEVLVSYFWDEVRRLMWNLVGIVRSNRRLELAANRLALIKNEVRDYYWRFTITPDLIELRNIIQVAELVVNCAAKRRESRGLHFNVDYPNINDSLYSKNTTLPTAFDETECSS